MYTTECPRCKEEYSDSENKISIMLTGECLACRLDAERWETDGGYLL